jgi:hypothetical protein
MENTHLSLELFEEKYNISCPTMGQLIEIETNKMMFSNGKYQDLIRAASVGVLSSLIALDSIDGLATFMVLIPKIKDKIKYHENGDVSLESGLRIAKSYRENFFPWFSKIQDEINNEVNGITEKIKNVSDELKDFRE